MKKTIIILLSIIIIFSIILAYKITSSKNEDTDIADANIYDKDVYDEYNKYDDNSNQENQITIKKQPSSNNSQLMQTDVVTPQQEQLKQQLSQDSSSNYNNYQTTPKTSATNTQKEEQTINSNKTYTTPIEKEDLKLEYVAQMNSKIRNKFSGYGNSNIYWLESGSAFIQTDYTTERKTLSNPNVEVRYYVGSKQYKLYVNGMSTDVQVVSLNSRNGNVVFPEQEYYKYNGILQGLAGSGTLNSSSTKPYFDKLDDIKNNWTKLSPGRVICVSNTSYWEQIDSSVGTFKENAEVIVGYYNGKYYMLIDGIPNPILVKNYKI